VPHRAIRRERRRNPGSASAPPPVQPLPAWDEALSQWDKETPDPDPTQYLQSYFERALDDADGGSEIEPKVDCRQTLCRMVVPFKNLPALQRSANSLREDGFQFGYRVADGPSPDVTVLVSRPDP